MDKKSKDDEVVLISRDNELKVLKLLFSNYLLDSNKPYCQSTFFIHGEAGTGKTLVVKTMLKQCKFNHAYVNCTETYSERILFENIINQLRNHKLTEENNFRPFADCRDRLDFIGELKKMLDSQNVEKKIALIVLDEFEKLQRISKDVIKFFLKLREISCQNIFTIFISNLSWDAIDPTSQHIQPPDLKFNSYTEQEIFEILKLTRPPNFSESTYKNYLNLFLSIFYPYCRDTRELIFQVKKNFVLYSEPILNCELTETDSNALWRLSQPIFKKSLNTLFLKMDTDVEINKTVETLKVELPYYLKYMLIASYIASYNPASEDKRLFVKNHGKVRNKTRIKKIVNQHLIGPKNFTLERLFSIVTAILNDRKFTITADLFVGVGTLIKMNLLTQVGADILESGSFKCNVNLQFINVISRNVDFPITKYLVDFRSN